VSNGVNELHMSALLLQLIYNGLVEGGILALTGLGATLVFGIQRVANFAHGDYMTVGAYVAFLLDVTWSTNLVVAAIGAMVATAALAVGLHFVLLRPLRGRGLVALSLVTVGLGLVLRNALFLVEGSQARQYAFNQAAVIDLGFVRIAPAELWVGLTALVAVPAVAGMLAWTPLGKAMRAVADNRDLAEISGIDTDGIGLYVWIVAGGLAGLGGAMLALIQGAFDPNLGLNVLFLILTVVVLGGIGNAFGALLAGLVLGLVMEVSTWPPLFGGVPTQYQPVVGFMVLILLLMFRPQGLLGKARVL
jgi:neutral amino acid transport system permease protein